MNTLKFYTELHNDLLIEVFVTLHSLQLLCVNVSKNCQKLKNLYEPKMCEPNFKNFTHTMGNCTYYLDRTLTY